MRLAIPQWYGVKVPTSTGSCISSLRKPSVLLDAENLFGKLPFSPWRPCHKSCRRKSFTTSTFPSGKRRSSTAFSCVAILRKPCAGISKSLPWYWRSGIARRSESRSCAISLAAWWNTADTYWRFSIPWLVQTFTTIACSRSSPVIYPPPLPHALPRTTCVLRLFEKDLFLGSGQNLSDFLRQPLAFFLVLTAIGGTSATKCRTFLDCRAACPAVESKRPEKLRCAHATGCSSPDCYRILIYYCRSTGLFTTGSRSHCGSGASDAHQRAEERTEAKGPQDAQRTRQPVQAMAERGRDLHHFARRAECLPSTGYQRRTRAIHRSVLAAPQQQSGLAGQ